MTWPVVALGDIFEIARGGSPRPIDDYITEDADGLNWVMISDASASGKIIYRTKKRIKHEGLKKTRQVAPGDFILSNSMSFGRPYIMGTSGCIHDGWLLMRPKTAQFDADYFYYLLGSPDVYQSFASRAAGATVKNLNSEIVREVEIPLPPLDEQKRIAAILDQADALRRLRARALDRLNALGQAIFHEMFESGATLEKARVGDCVTRLTNGYVGPTRDIYVDDGVPYLLARHIKNSRITFDGKTRVTERFNEQNRRSKLKAGDVLMVQSGHIGETAVVPPEHEGHNCHALIVMTPVAEVLNGEFLSAAFSSPRMTQEFQSLRTGQTLPHLNCRDVKEMQIPLPPLDVQHQFLKRKRHAQVLVHKIEASTARIEALFASLQHRAFRGEL